MEYVSLIFQALILFTLIIIGWFVKNYFPSYMNKKGENLATKEDVGEITAKIEQARMQYVAEIEEIKFELQRELENEKIKSQSREQFRLKEAESYKEFKLKQVMPFFEKLNLAITKSYAVVQAPLYLAQLAPHIPEVRKMVTDDLYDWLEATLEASNHRMSALAALDTNKISEVAMLMKEMVDSIREIQEKYHYIFYPAKRKELTELQRSYVRNGFRLQLVIKNLITAFHGDDKPITSEESYNLANLLSETFEQGGIVAFKKGKWEVYSWLAIWQLKVGENLSQLEEMLKNLSSELYKLDSMLEVNMIGGSNPELRTWCIVARFSSAQLRDDFINKKLVKLKHAYKQLWLDDNTPSELRIE